MTTHNNNANEEFGKFITKVRDESIEVIASLLDPNRTDSYSMSIKKLYSDTHNEIREFSLALLPAFVDEVITVLLQRLDKTALNDRKIDILYSDDLGEIISDDSVYKHTESLGLDYVDEWRKKYGKYNVFDPE